MSDDFAEVFKTLVNDTKTIEPLPIGSFCTRLHNKARYNTTVMSLFKYIPEDTPNYPPDGEEEDWHSQEIDQLDNAAYYLGLLSSHALFNGISLVSKSKDPKGYKDWVITDNAHTRYLEIISMLMAYCLGEHLNAQLASKGHSTLKDLRNMIGFKDYAFERMKDDDFIDGEIWIDQNNKDHRFSMYLLFIADYLIYQPGAMPGYGGDFTSRPSYSILEHWSQNIWENHASDDNDQTDQLVTFCGNLSTIAYVPVTDSGLVRPTPTFTVMNDFYRLVIDSARRRRGTSDAKYADAVSDSLDRLEDAEATINQWKTYCEEMEDNFSTRFFGYWEEAVNTAFSNKDWQNVADWATFASSADYNYTTMPDLHSVGSVPPDIHSLGSSFLSGTQIHLADEKVCSVEDMKHGDRVLVSVDPPKYKTTEGASRLQSEAVLVGFNGESPFTTSSQVFRTSTGLRAVDPRAAHAVNPFQQVGRLAVGHYIYRLEKGSYQPVEITSIETAPRATHTLYALSVQGDQTHHANGYLVSLNNPVHSAQSTASLLQQLPSDKRLSYLASRRELRPLFLKHGVKTIQTKLDRELSNPSYVPRSKFDQRSLVQSARGVALDAVESRFQLTPSSETRLPSGYSLPDLNILDGRIVADGQAQLRSILDADKRTFRWTRQLPSQGLFEHGLLKIYPHGGAGTGVIYLANDSDPVEIVSKENLHTFHARAINPLEKSLCRSEGIQPFASTRTYQLTFDRDVWPPDTEWNSVNNPIDGGEIQLGITTTEEGYEVPTAKIPVLDDLQQQINQKYEKDLDPLYSVTQTVVSSGNPQYTVRFNRASLIPFLSDGGTSGDNFNVEFNSELGIGVTLPCLFRELQVEIDPMFPEDSKARLFEYDPEMRGMKGNRHFVSLTKKKSEAAHFDALRAKVSRAFAESFRPGMVNYQEPAQVTNSLHTEVAPSVSALIDFNLYKDQDTHDASQKLIHTMMLYHMNDDDRENFTNAAKPVTLPSELADGLDSKLKDFLRNKYAPAYLCNSFVGSDKYAKLFTDKEQKKLWYWWQGNGEKCLARTKEYNDLNDLTAVHSVKNLHATFLSPYLNSNPENWAQQMLSVLQREPVLDRLLTHPIQFEQNLVNQHSCIMHALAPDQKFADTWFEKIMTYTFKSGLEYSTISEFQSEARQWLQDSMTTLLVRVISKDATVASNVHAELLVDVEQYEKDNNLDQSQSAEKRAANIVSQQSAVLDEASTWVTSEGKGLDKAWSGTSLYQWLSQAFDKIYDKFQASKLLKGVFTTCMAAYKLFRISYSLVGLIRDWDEMSDEDRAQVILEMLNTTTEGLEYAIEAWKVWKGRTGMVILDQLDTALMDQGTYRALDERGSDLASMSDEVNGENGFHETVAEHVSGGEGTATGSETEAEGGWNESISNLPEDLPPNGKKTASEIRIQGNVLKILNTALGLGVAIAMTFSLVHDWDNLSLPNKIINVLAVVTQALSVMLDIIDLGVSMELWTVSATLSAALPVVGVVLVVVGVILALVSFLVNLFGSSDTQEDKVKKYVDNTGKSVIAGFDDAPEPQLEYSIKPSEATSGNVQTITLEAVNSTNEDIALAGITISISSGENDVCLFSDTDKIVLVEDTDSSKDTPQHVYVTPDSDVGGSLPFRDAYDVNSVTYYQYNLQVGGPKKENESLLQQLVVKPAQRFSAVWKATVNSKGSSKVDIVEKKANDKSHKQLVVSRV